MTAPRVLFVTRDATVATVMAIFLEHCGYEPATVLDVVKARVAVLKQLPRVVIVDAELRHMAWNLIRSLKEDEATRATPVIAVHVTDEKELQDARAAGSDGCLGMPLDTQALLALLGEYAPLPIPRGPA